MLSPKELHAAVAANYTKRAVKRGFDGFHVDCTCGAAVKVEYPDGPDVTCACGIVYDARGWIIR